MNDLLISRGNANQNIRALIDWGLIQKELKCGDRKEYFSAEKDMWKIMKQIITHRKKRELDPVIEALSELHSVESNCPESDEFCRMVRELKHFSRKADAALDMIIRTETNGFIGKVFNMIH
jgi:DNA-binding transcriptional regulator GbsR (MarR family)